jgi:predicted double-glycine peptidase
MRGNKMLKEQEVNFKATKIIDYPGFRQSTKYSCGVTVTQSVLIYCLGNKYDMPESELFDKLNISKTGGVDPQTIVKFLKSKGVDISVETLTVEDLKNNIDQNKPTIICIQAWGDEKDYTNIYKEGHYVTVIGYNNDGLIFEDPGISGRYGFIKYGKLDSKWHDMDKYGNKYDHLGLVIKCRKKYSPEKMEIIEGYKMNIIENYLTFLFNPTLPREAKDWRGHNLPVEGDDRPNWIGMCMHLESDRAKINCLRKLKEQTAMNPFYQYRIDRFVDAITQRYEPTDKPGMVPELKG